MTGFERGNGVTGPYAWSWEIKSVNAKGLDLRLRLPQGWDAVEVPARTRATEKLSRGTVYATLTVERKGVQATVKVNGQTGVEMEALTAVSIACLTLYDMVKAVEKGMRIEGIRLLEKQGGKSGH